MATENKKPPDRDDNILLPCPFCGSRAVFEYAEQDDGMGRAYCDNYQCGIGFFDDRDSAIKSWNTRAST